jgi:hypothetical protein
MLSIQRTTAPRASPLGNGQYNVEAEAHEPGAHFARITITSPGRSPANRTSDPRKRYRAHATIRGLGSGDEITVTGNTISSRGVLWWRSTTTSMLGNPIQPYYKCTLA